MTDLSQLPASDEAKKVARRLIDAAVREMAEAFPP